MALEFYHSQSLISKSFRQGAKKRQSECSEGIAMEDLPALHKSQINKSMQHNGGDNNKNKPRHLECSSACNI